MTSRRAAGNQDALGQSDSRDSTGDEHFDQLTDRIRATSSGRSKAFRFARSATRTIQKLN